MTLGCPRCSGVRCQQLVTHVAGRASGSSTFVTKDVKKKNYGGVHATHEALNIFANRGQMLPHLDFICFVNHNNHVLLLKTSSMRRRNFVNFVFVRWIAHVLDVVVE